MNVRLYFTIGMPAWPARRIMVQISSIARSRAGSLASRISGISALAIGAEDMGNGTQSSVIPNDSTCFRRRPSASRLHAFSTSRPRFPLQILVTPNAASARSVISVWSCWWPAFISTGRRRPGVAAVAACAVPLRLSAAAPTEAVDINRRRPMGAADVSGDRAGGKRGSFMREGNGATAVPSCEEIPPVGCHWK